MIDVYKIYSLIRELLTKVKVFHFFFSFTLEKRKYLINYFKDF